MALTDIKVRAAKPTDKQYKLTDGGGMHLLVHPNGSKYWRLQYRYEGKQKMLALGVYPEITLADARVRRDEARNLLANGVDPGDKKKNDKVEQSKARTFKEVAIEWHGTNKKWSEDHAHRVLKSLEVKWSTKTGHRVRVFSSIDFPIRLVVTHHYIRAVLVRCNIQRYSPLLRELHR